MQHRGKWFATHHGALAAAVTVACLSFAPGSVPLSAASGPSAGASVASSQAVTWPCAARPADEGARVRVGAFSYRVLGSKWHPEGLAGPGGKTARASLTFLSVEIEACNIGSTEQIVSPFRLRLEAGPELEQADNTWQVPGAFDPCEPISPGQARTGRVYFDVPAGHRYWLVVRGGFQSDARACVALQPK